METNEIIDDFMRLLKNLFEEAITQIVKRHAKVNI